MILFHKSSDRFTFGLNLLIYNNRTLSNYSLFNILLNDDGRRYSDAESIPCKEKFGKWNLEKKNIFKEGCKKPLADNSLNNGAEKVDTQTPESQATSATPEDLFKQLGKE